MSDADLNVLMGQLLRAQAYKYGSPSSEIRVNAEGKAKDDGSDGWSGKPATADDWLGSADTCWQFKTGTVGEPIGTSLTSKRSRAVSVPLRFPFPPLSVNTC